MPFRRYPVVEHLSQFSFIAVHFFVVYIFLVMDLFVSKYQNIHLSSFALLLLHLLCFRIAVFSLLTCDLRG